MTMRKQHPKKRKYDRYEERVGPKIEEIAKRTAAELTELALKGDHEDLQFSFGFLRHRLEGELFVAMALKEATEREELKAKGIMPYWMK
jgi:hypothetical protein